MMEVEAVKQIKILKQELQVKYGDDVFLNMYKSLDTAIDSLETWDKIFTEYETLTDRIVAEGDEKHATERIDAWCINMLRSVISDYYAKRIIEDANRNHVESEE